VHRDRGQGTGYRDRVHLCVPWQSTLIRSYVDPVIVVVGFVQELCD